MINKIKNKIFNDQFLRHNIIFFSGSMLVAFINYLFYLILGRMMTVDAFGEIQALLSLFGLFSIFLGIFRVIIINLISNNKDEKDRKERIFIVEKFGYYITIAAALIIILASSEFKNIFQFSSSSSFISLAILLIFTLFFTYQQAILQGLHKFYEVSVAGVIGSVTRIILAVIFIALGFETLGVMGGLIISQIIALIYVDLKAKNHSLPFLKTKIKLDGRLKSEFSYGFIILISTLCVTFLYTSDMLIVKHYFSPEQAGLYSGIATIGHIVFFATGSVAGVLLPTIKIGAAHLENKKIFKKAVILVGMGGAAILIFFYVFPQFTIRLLIGNRFEPYSNLLAPLGLLSFIVSVINLIFFYYLALRKKFIVYISIISPILVLTLCYFFHNSLLQVIYNFMTGAIVVLFYLIIRYFLVNKIKVEKILPDKKYAQINNNSNSGA